MFDTEEIKYYNKSNNFFLNNWSTYKGDNISFIYVPIRRYGDFNTLK
jgi:hypothetical protein